MRRSLAEEPIVRLILDPRNAIWRSRSPAALLLLPAAFANPTTLMLGLSRMASISLRSAVFAAKALGLRLAWRGGGEAAGG
jgi:hypothetical protein